MPPFAISIIGLSSSGKSTLGRRLFRHLAARDGLALELVDGDTVRDFLKGKIDYTPAGRRLSASVQTLVAFSLYKHGVSSIVCNISPFEESRRFARSRIANFIEIYLECPLVVCMERDEQLHKNVYQPARGGQVQGANVVGLDIEFEVPANPDLVLRTHTESEDDSLARLLAFLELRWGEALGAPVLAASAAGLR
ncbi:MAG: adenylyl-sulfate kinase [Candidatus Latescibacteria bacterium]|nr:adenylyl-sulfate kinase [Candidatus Latescibacterota bacterium]